MLVFPLEYNTNRIRTSMLAGRADYSLAHSNSQPPNTQALQTTTTTTTQPIGIETPFCQLMASVKPVRQAVAAPAIKPEAKPIRADACEKEKPNRAYPQVPASSSKKRRYDEIEATGSSKVSIENLRNRTGNAVTQVLQGILGARSLLGARSHLGRKGVVGDLAPKGIPLQVGMERHSGGHPRTPTSSSEPAEPHAALSMAHSPSKRFSCSRRRPLRTKTCSSLRKDSHPLKSAG
jgi:hypothetical protein